MKGMALEYVFKMFLYVVVVIVVISLIIHFREEISSSLKLCEYLSIGCGEEKCETIQASEDRLEEKVIKKYCDLCWRKTGSKDYGKDCFCYIVSGSFFVNNYNLPEYCEMECRKDATSLIFIYNSLMKKVFVQC
ncbi:MAG: hypothetical protein QW228_02315 [Candidatus Aenigmatarchaeota archaeon]